MKDYVKGDVVRHKSLSKIFEIINVMGRRLIFSKTESARRNSIEPVAFVWRKFTEDTNVKGEIMIYNKKDNVFFIGRLEYINYKLKRLSYTYLLNKRIELKDLHKNYFWKPIIKP